MLQIEKKDTRCVHARDFPLPPIIKTRSGGSHPPPLQHGRIENGGEIAFPQLYIAVAQCDISWVNSIMIMHVLMRAATRPACAGIHSAANLHACERGRATLRPL